MRDRPQIALPAENARRPFAVARGIRSLVGAPEQLLRQSLGRAARRLHDGGRALETLTGRSLFRSPTPTATLRKILVEPVLAPSHFAPAITPTLDAIVLRGLAREPTARFAASTSEVARALLALDLASVRRRRALADSVRTAEDGRCTSSAALGI